MLKRWKLFVSDTYAFLGLLWDFVVLGQDIDI